MITAALATPTLVLAATPRTWEELVNRLVYILDFAIGTLVMLALVIYFFGILLNTRKSKEGGDTSQMRTFLLWGMIALFVMVSIWGILQILQATIFSGEGLQPGASGTGSPCTGFGIC